MASKKIVCLGGGSLYFPRALSDLMLSRELTGSEIVLYDLDGEKVERMKLLGDRLAREAGADFTIRSTTNLADAVDDADFAISSIGGSGAEVSPTVYDSYYHNCDMFIPAKYGIYQVVGDTGGPGGMMMALRSIPAYIHICREMEKRCPKVILLNHSNPMAPLCRAMRKYTSINTIGICHGVQIGICAAAEVLGVPPQELECVWVGTNHYYWFTRVVHKGNDVYPELMRRMRERQPQPGRLMSTAISQVYGYQIVYPDDDHIIEFYPFATQIKDPTRLIYGLADAHHCPKYSQTTSVPTKPTPPTPATRAEFLKNYQAILDGVTLPKEQDNSVTGESLATLIEAIAAGRRQLAIVNIPNDGVVSNLPNTALLEVEAVTDSQGVRGIHVGDAPLHLKGILEKRLVWQEFVADAAVTGDRNLALQALLIDEMAIRPELAKQMLDELLNASKDLLPQFKF